MEFVTLRHKFFYYAAAFLSVSLYAPVHNNGCQASPAILMLKKAPYRQLLPVKGAFSLRDYTVPPLFITLRLLAFTNCSPALS
ncbi:hypothetical protein D7V94_10875 [Parablautia intestinalis]|uniref:Uncharacterized protein n=1 Tax=Parablautia intestinalis TaxID=2320100 RepID=A0A3A9AJA4_9FIRM|nr:hypothetical protein D7V94_10875 [Parablautia intestinalis]